MMIAYSGMDKNGFLKLGGIVNGGYYFEVAEISNNYWSLQISGCVKLKWTVEGWMKYAGM